jgi:branched-chain amino acid transport system permease protein
VELLYYLATLGVFFCFYNILTWGLNIQFGYAGILDFTYITFMAIGAYFAGVTALGRPTFSDQQYVLGFGWTFPWTILVGAGAAGLLGLGVGSVLLLHSRLRSDYLGIVTVAFGTICYDLIGNFTPLFNGWNGIQGVPAPLSDQVSVDPLTYTVFFLIACVVICGVLWFVANRIYSSPLGRSMRAVREDLEVAEAFGKNAFRVRLLAMVVGCIYAGIAGGLLISFIGGMAPDGFTPAETFFIWAAMLVGGRGNNLGAIVGSFLVPVIFVEATRFLPAIPGHPELIPAFRNMAIGLLLILMLWFRPQGAVPERQVRYFELPVSLDKAALTVSD